MISYHSFDPFTVARGKIEIASNGGIIKKINLDEYQQRRIHGTWIRSTEKIIRAFAGEDQSFVEIAIFFLHPKILDSVVII